MTQRVLPLLHRYVNQSPAPANVILKPAFWAKNLHWLFSAAVSKTNADPSPQKGGAQDDEVCKGFRQTS
jgi:hypothetical protein